MDRTSPTLGSDKHLIVNRSFGGVCIALVGIVASTFIAVSFAGAQQATGSEQPQFGTGGTGSASYQKEERLLPGENVVTPSGQKMKVWSTEGPVPVSRAPEPFSPPNGATINPNVGVIVDGRQGVVRSPSVDTFEVPPANISPGRPPR